MTNVEKTSNMIYVVRCKDCQHCYYDSNRAEHEQHICGKHGITVKQNWFCGDGKRKEQFQ